MISGRFPVVFRSNLNRRRIRKHLGLLHVLKHQTKLNRTCDISVQILLNVAKRCSTENSGLVNTKIVLQPSKKVEKFTPDKIKNSKAAFLRDVQKARTYIKACNTSN